MDKQTTTTRRRRQRVAGPGALVAILLLLLLPAGCAESAPVVGAAQMARMGTATAVPRQTVVPLPTLPATASATAVPRPTRAPTATVPPTPPLPTLTAPPATAYPDPPSPPPPPPPADPTAYPGVAPPHPAVPHYGYRIVNSYPHDRLAYTQGLLVDSSPGILLESTGLRGESSLRRVALETGDVVQQLAVPEQYFAEGIAVVADRIIQLTWQSGQGFVYDRQSFELLEQFSYSHEGWGIAFDGERLIVSDGTDVLRFWDPQTLVETGQVSVFDPAGPIYRLNELEVVGDEVWANVYQTDLIARVDPLTGAVTGWIDLSGLLAPEFRDGTENVLNGIAYDAENGRLFVTGKRWPLLFEIELVELD